MRASEILVESMWLYPGKLTQMKFSDGVHKVIDSVLPKEWTQENLGWANNGKAESDFDYEEWPIDNPQYRPDMDMNLSNANMDDLMNSLGFDNDGDSSYNIPIDQFIQACQRWLKTHIGKQVGGRDSKEEERAMSGDNINYEFLLKKKIKDKTEELLRSPDIRQEAESLVRVAAKAAPGNPYKDLYPDVETTINVLATRRATAYAEYEIGLMKEKNKKPIGPRMIQGGREDGYLNKKVMQALKIAQEGKQRGAELISAA